MRINEDKYTINIETFNVGRTCLSQICNFFKEVEPFQCGLKDKMSNGNGALIRMLPVALYSYCKKSSLEEIIKKQ